MKTEIILPLTIAGGFIVLYLLQEEEVPEIKKSPEIKKLDKEIEKLDEEISLALENEKQILTEKEKNAQAIIQLKKAEIEKANEEFEKAKKKVTAEYKQRLERARELRDIREKEERAAREKELNEEFRETFKRKELEKLELEKRNKILTLEKNLEVVDFDSPIKEKVSGRRVVKEGDFEFVIPKKVVKGKGTLNREQVEELKRARKTTELDKNK